MNHEEIKAAIYEKGYTLAMIAECINKHPSHISSIIHRRNTSSVIAKAIAKVIDKPVEQVFPDVPAYRCKQKKAATLNQRKAELAALFSSTSCE
ncbi:helix-turn-helix domain-containing protein [Pseudoalteromonas sp. US3C1013]|uniref:helix-turn-helix domain-containing protein n=1 Tax=unclassified Pseudoalteromonas TaxID=194690 RepID=UPI003AB4A527